MRILKVLLVASLLMCSAYALAEDEQETETASDSLSWIGDCEAPNYRKIYYALEQDPIGYFNPPDVSTDLEVKLYKKTTEYKELLAKLKEIRSKVMATRYCMSTGFDINEYNTAKRSIEIKVGDNYCNHQSTVC